MNETMAMLGSLSCCSLLIDLGTTPNYQITIAAQSDELVNPLWDDSDIFKSDLVLELIRHCSEEGGMTRKKCR